MAKGGHPIDLAVTLHVRNAPDAEPLVAESVAYRGTARAPAQDHLPAPVAVRPVGWVAAGSIAEPVVEAPMLGSPGSRGCSFVGQGRPTTLVGWAAAVKGAPQRGPCPARGPGGRPRPEALR